MIYKNSSGLVAHKKLDEDEARVFMSFLFMERERHMSDINKINETLKYLENKFGFELELK